MNPFLTGAGRPLRASVANGVFAATDDAWQTAPAGTAFVLVAIDAPPASRG